MFDIVKFIVVFTAFLAWLFGKLVWNEIRTTFRGWFPFLYFIYLVFVVVLPDNVQVQKFNFIDYIIFFFFITSIYKDLFRGFRYFIRLLSVGNKFIEKLDNVKKYLFVKKLEDVSEFLLAIVLVVLVYIQISYAIPMINLVNKSNLELLGFIVGVFSMYGIYIGFLQYLAGDIKSDTYLGKSKVNYLIEKSFWYHLTQSKLFILMLLITVIVPIAVKLNVAFTKEITILWQTSYLLLLIIYIFLLSMSLYIIRFALLMKSKDDENLKYNIRKQIQEDYTELFWLNYYSRDRYNRDFIKKKLTRDFSKLDSNEYEEFVTNIFNLDYLDNRNLYWTISNKTKMGFELTRIQKFRNCLSSDDRKNEYDLEQKWKDFYKYVRTFIFGKWEFLEQNRENFSEKNWKKLITEDLKIIDDILIKDQTLASLKIEYPEKDECGCLRQRKDRNIREYLFNLLIDKKEVNLDEIFGDIIKEIKNFKEDRIGQFEKYTCDFLTFRIKNILDKYINDNNIDLNFPKFKRLSDYNVFQNNKRNDYEKSMLYSKFCFNYLGEGRIEDFSDSTIEQEANDPKKLKSQRIQSLILSMNEEYRLAFLLYQLLYTDDTQWDNNLKFYDKEIRKIMNYDKQYRDYLFNQAKEIILSTNISHRITEVFLDKLWQTRFDKINSFSWFGQFGIRHQMSDLKILYLQELLSGRSFDYAKSRIYLERDFSMKITATHLAKIKKDNKISIENVKWKLQRKQERQSSFCKDYLLLTDQLTTIFTKKSYSHEKNDLQASVEYLLYSNKVNLLNVIDSISVSSLLRLEWILRWNYCQYMKKSNYTSRTLLDMMTDNSRYFWLSRDGILEFYIVKITDNFYDDLYHDSEFMSDFKRHLEMQLILLNKTVEEYVELIAEKVSGIGNISVLQKGQIISRLNDILFRQNNRTKTSPKRKY